MLEKNGKIDTNEYVTNIKEMLDQGYEIVMSVAGWSMQPFLRNMQDRVLLTKTDQPLTIGDIVFYQRTSGQYVLHRIYKKKSDGYYMAGDHLLELEGPIAENAIFAKVIEVERDNRWISTNQWFWKMAFHMWKIMYPIRKLYYGIKRQ